MEQKYNFIIIDDSALDCFIAEKMVKHTGLSNDIKSFMGASEALDFINNTKLQGDNIPTVVVLDVLMPVMSGASFVEAFEQLPDEIQNKYIIVALTSSMNRNDMEKISSFKTVKTLLDKPITSELLLPILS